MRLLVAKQGREPRFLGLAAAWRTPSPEGWLAAVALFGGTDCVVLIMHLKIPSHLASAWKQAG